MYNRAMPADEQANWRVILSAPSSGPENMALDQALLESAQGDGKAPTLRLYGWRPPCLSIGYAQEIRQVDLEAIDRFGWDLVRRPTGGSAILHTDEITYSVCGPVDHWLFEGGVLPSYRRLSQALLSALGQLGLIARASAAPDTAANGRSPVCFQDPGAFEIKAGSRKLVGSAQVRRRGSVLQHGSLPLNGDIARICDGLRFSDQAQRELAARAVRQNASTLEQALGRRVSWVDAANALRGGFEREFQVTTSVQEPATEEIDRTHQLLESRYAHPDWTRRI